MKREAKLLLKKGVDSLILSVDNFNGSSDRGRVEAVLILLDHAFEMLLKATLVQRGVEIRDDKNANHTIGFDACVRKGLTDGAAKFLSYNQALTLQVINGLRDAAQHHLLDISEQHLYITTQSGITLFRDLLQSVFGDDLVKHMPNRVLPVSSMPPVDIEVLFKNELEAIRQLLQPGKRKNTEALARIRPLAIVNNALEGRSALPSDAELGALGKQIKTGKAWNEIFPGVAVMQISTTGVGPSIEIHWTKKEGIPIHVVPDEDPASSGVVAVKRVNELGFYNLNLTELSEKVGLGKTKCLALIEYLDLQANDDCFMLIKIGSQTYKRYSQKAITLLNKHRDKANEAWMEHKSKQKRNQPRKKHKS